MEKTYPNFYPEIDQLKSKLLATIDEYFTDNKGKVIETDGEFGVLSYEVGEVQINKITEEGCTNDNELDRPLEFKELTISDLSYIIDIMNNGGEL